MRSILTPRQPVVPSLLLLCVSLCCAPASAQSLTRALRSEPVESLARAAREQGSAVRGAILFTQQNLACTRCHAPGQRQPLGPDLSQLAENVTDTYLVESLLHPSKAIRQGFESSTVVTAAGRVLTGRIVQRTPDGLTLRLATDDLRLVTLASDQVEQVSTGRQSAMPDNLADQLSDRGQFLDLVRYLMELAAAAANRSLAHQGAGGGRIPEELQGIVLLKEFHCSACHQDVPRQVPLTDKRPPELTWSAGRIDPAYVERFIADPAEVRPGTSMPNMLQHLDASQRKAAATELTHYLASLAERAFAPQPIDAEAAERGRELFHSVGCVACHPPRTGEGTELPADDSVSLASIERKYNVDGLVAFLKNPLAARPSGRMPQMQLTHWEALDLAHYLLHPAAPDRRSPHEPFRQDAELVGRGKVRFEQLGCANCHSPAADAARSSAPPLAQVDPRRGCLSSEAGPWPRFSLSDSQRQAIRAALAVADQELSPSDQVDLTLTAFRCLHCHQRGSLGGLTAERDPFFQTTDPNLGPQGRIPPPLTGVGAKLNPQWLRQVLVSGRTIRPYVVTRMPHYGTENVAHLVDLFPRVDQLPPLPVLSAPVPPDAEPEATDVETLRKTGADLVGTGGLNCIVCHTFQLKKAANMSAVDLTDMAERLQKNWFYHYLRDPQRLSPNTIMPSFWPGGRALRTDFLDGKSDLQIEALWQYLLDGRQARTPRGLIVEPIELLATDEAVMLRRSYPGLGKRGIGVGYPHQVNLVFDAEQMRLAMLWQGKFADPGGVWRSQGHGTVRPLGEKLIRFAAGPDLDDAEHPWIVDDGRPPRHQFAGYSLDDTMRPRFRYRLDGLRVEDYPLDLVDASTGQPYLRRTVTLRSAVRQDQPGSFSSQPDSSSGQPDSSSGQPDSSSGQPDSSSGQPGSSSGQPGAGPGQLRFRAATGKSIERTAEGDFLVDGLLRIRIASQHAGSIVAGEEFQQLTISLPLVDGSAQLILEYRW